MAEIKLDGGPGVTSTIYDARSMKDAVSNCLVDLGRRYQNMVCVTPDVATSARTKQFEDEFPERFFNVGIAEQEATSLSAGLAHEGFIPFLFEFASFASMRACEQVRTNICYSNLPVRIISSNAGYSMGAAGATHCGLEDTGIMCSIENMSVIEPGDPYLIARVLEASMHWDGPIYLRLGREASGTLYGDDVKFEIGKTLTPKDGGDGAFIACGIVVHHALEAAKLVKERTGADIRVVAMHTIKPIDREAVVSAAKTGRIVCAQDGNIIGGLGYQVAAVLAEERIGCKLKMLGAPDEFVPIATPDFLFHRNEYDAEGLAKNMIAML